MDSRISSPCEGCSLKRAGCECECIRMRAFANEKPKMEYLKSIERGKHRNPISVKASLEAKLSGF